MAVLSETERAAASAEIQRTTDCPGTVTKAQLRAAIDATDAWIDSNAASFNSALPTAARNALTARQKAALFMFVASRRFGVA
jgi:hypothetical protein